MKEEFLTWSLVGDRAPSSFTVLCRVGLLPSKGWGFLPLGERGARWYGSIDPEIQVKTCLNWAKFWGLTPKAPNKNCSRRHFSFSLLSSAENKAWFFTWIEDSLVTSSHIFSEKQWKKYECRLLQSWLELKGLIQYWTKISDYTRKLVISDYQHKRNMGLIKIWNYKAFYLQLMQIHFIGITWREPWVFA